MQPIAEFVQPLRPLADAGSVTTAARRFAKRSHARVKQNRRVWR